jgi:hypothetical protein
MAMRCDEIRERIVDVLYDEPGGSAKDAELRAHLRTCPACREELAELKQTRNYLQIWKDETPLRSVATTARRASAGHRMPAPSVFSWRYLRYAAIAAMAVICLLAIANTHVSWNKEGFSFRASLFAGHEAEKDYYTKQELRDLLEQALDDTESRVNETNFMMMQRMLDTIEQDRWMDLRYVRSSGTQNRDKN